MKPMYLICTLLTMIAFSGCEDVSQAPEEDPVAEEEVNPNPPASNDLIVHQVVLGDPDKQSSLWEITDAGDGGFYFRGYYNNKYAVGKLDQTGQEDWAFRSRYMVRDLALVSGLSGELGNSLVTLGGFDANFDGDVDMGYVSLFHCDGGLIDELTFSSDSTEVWLNAVTLAGSSDDLCHFLAAGGAKMAGKYYPFIAEFNVGRDSTMNKVGEKIFTDFPDRNFRNIQRDPEKVDPVFYLQGDEYFTDTGYGDQTVYRMSAGMEITWSQDIVPQEGFQSWTLNGRGFACASSHLFLANTTEIDKETEPSSGGYWDAGVISRLSSEGSVDWVKSIVLSQYSDRFSTCCVNDGVLTAGGICSSFRKTKSRNQFGNALLLRVDPETGETMSALSFGSKHYSSQFNHVVSRGTQAIAVGLTHYEVDEGPYQAWFVIIDVGGKRGLPGLAEWVGDASGASGADDGAEKSPGDAGR